jgi:hypothetical protein
MYMSTGGAVQSLINVRDRAETVSLSSTTSVCPVLQTPVLVTSADDM